MDHVQVGEGRRGPVTEQLQRHFFDIVYGRSEDVYDWLTPVYEESTSGEQPVASDSSRA